MSRSKYINTFNTTADYNNYIESALPEFPNVGYDKQAGVVNIRRQSPNDYQIWGTTTATENFNIMLNNKNVEVTVDTLTGEFYLTGWTGTLTNLQSCFKGNNTVTSIKKFAIDTSNVINIFYFLYQNSTCKILNFNGCDFSNVTNATFAFGGALTDVYINIEGTLNTLTNNLSSQGGSYIPSSATIHYNGVDYKWQNNAWTPQS